VQAEIRRQEEEQRLKDEKEAERRRLEEQQQQEEAEAEKQVCLLLGFFFICSRQFVICTQENFAFSLSVVGEQSVQQGTLLPGVRYPFRCTCILGILLTLK